MKVTTKYLGEVEVQRKNIFDFPFGLPGFQEEKQFVLLDVPGNEIFQFLQSVFTPTLAFVVANPYHFYTDYTFEVDESTKETLQITEEKDVVILSILTIQDPFSSSTINLKAPIILQAKHKIGKQLIINQEDYSLKALLHGNFEVKEEGGLNADSYKENI